MASLADTSFRSGPDDKAEVSDIYSDSLKRVGKKIAKDPTGSSGESNPIEALLSDKKAAKEKALEVAGSLKKPNKVFRDVAKSVDLSGDGISFDVEEGRARLMEQVGGAGGLLDNLNETLIDKALGFLGFEDAYDCVPGPGGKNGPQRRNERRRQQPKGYKGTPCLSGPGGVPKGKRNGAGMTLGTKEGIKTAYGSVTRIIEEGKDVDSAKGVTELLNTMVQDEAQTIDMLDLGAQAATLSVILDEATRLGIPGAIDTILDKIGDDNPKQQRRMLLNNLRLAVMRCDLGVIEKAIIKIGPQVMLERMPDFINMFLTFYTFPSNTSVSNHRTLRTQMLAILNDVDADWDKYDRVVSRDQGGGNFADETDVIISLDPFAYASEDALTLFMMDPDVGETDYKSVALVAPDWPSQSLVALGEKRYPNAAFETA